MNGELDLHTFEPTAPVGGWTPKIPERAKAALAKKIVAFCAGCGTRDGLGETDTGAIACLPCWRDGGHGFAWARLPTGGKLPRK